jgi:hypothetical protein
MSKSKKNVFSEEVLDKVINRESPYGSLTMGNGAFGTVSEIATGLHTWDSPSQARASQTVRFPRFTETVTTVADPTAETVWVGNEATAWGLGDLEPIANSVQVADRALSSYAATIGGQGAITAADMANAVRTIRHANTTSTTVTASA